MMICRYNDCIHEYIVCFKQDQIKKIYYSKILDFIIKIVCLTPKNENRWFWKSINDKNLFD